MKKNYYTSPLPFRGQKRSYIKQFKSVLERCEDITTVVDLFGGSGLLSRAAKDALPKARVIYNDYDHFDQRILMIDRTNALLDEIVPLVKDVEPLKQIPREIKQECLMLMRKYEETGAVDYITLSASLLFSGNYADSYNQFAKQTFYNRMVRTDYDATGYFDGLEITHKDYRELFGKFKNKEHVLFVIDPPYLSTECNTYRNEGYWKLKDYLEVLTILKGSKSILFTSDKSELIELCEWIDTNSTGVELLKNAELFEISNAVTKGISYKDIMVVKLT